MRPLTVFWAEEGGLPPADRGLAYGDGLFETIRMRGRQGTLLGRHLARLARDAGRLGIPVDDRSLRPVVAEAVRRYGDRPEPGDWVLKLTLTRGAGGRGYRPDAGMRPHLLVSASPMPPLPAPGGVSVDFSPVPLAVNPMLAGIKSLNRLEQVMAARDLTPELFELIQSNAQGQLVEGTRTNLLIRRADGWKTPPVASLAVAGVMRQWVLERLRARGEPVAEVPLELADLMDGDCRCFYLLNSVLGVVPVASVAGHHLPVDAGLATICDPLDTLE
ncbi:aminodeoxychorismate lyase [Marinobacter sp. C2H3]|uniref:aminodeoxychorismate lyase n=1 Tax=Marinobacter sp. C2H3 TaxID=3119003 RepID=UPI00300E6ED0